MKYQKGIIEDGKIKIISSKVIDQSKLTSDCWLIQFYGLTACKNCELKNTTNCGGSKTLKSLLTKKINYSIIDIDNLTKEAIK